MEHVTSNGSSTSFGAITIAASMGLVNLQHEPQRLTAEAERLNQDFEGLVMDNYKIFVENLTCSVFLRSEVRRIPYTFDYRYTIQLFVRLFRIEKSQRLRQNYRNDYMV